MRKLIYLILFAFLTTTFAQNKLSKLHSKQNLECTTCHECEVPTKTNPCLALCPRDKSKGISNVYKLEKAAKVFEINNIKGEKDIYAPVVFSHKVHAEMSEMNNGCITCHHYNPPGEIVKCTFCHEVDRNKSTINMPDLKSAYHRQCMDCHKTWEEKTKCENCHTLNNNYKPENAESSTVKINLPLKRPITKVYETEKYIKGKLVSFHHNDHVELFGLECTSCHKDESCQSCHNQKLDFKKTIDTTRHSRCESCHSAEIKNQCAKCHSEKETAPFNHFTNTGFDITKYHSKNSCKSCHAKAGNFSGLKAQCQSCHKWNGDNFDHSITGLKLSEDHIDLECSDCHENNNYKKPTCSSCHDEAEGFIVPQKLPGEKVN